MREYEAEIQTKDGAMDTFICHPEEDGPFPAIIIYMDAPGIREELRDMARRLGTVGYFVMLPNLYGCIPALSPKADFRNSSSSKVSY